MVVRKKNKAAPPPKECPLSQCLSIIGGAWTLNIIWYLSVHPRRFSELQGDLVKISAKVLMVRLRRLEKDGVVIREVKPTSPPTVEYSLSELGRELIPVIKAIVDVGHRLKELKNIYLHGQERPILHLHKAEDQPSLKPLYRP